jgi:hypothetical protein
MRKHEKIEYAFHRWATKKAEWYQIWLPGSGAVGGAIAGFILTWLLILILT